MLYSAFRCTRSNINAEQKCGIGSLLLRARGPLGADAYTSIGRIGDEASNADTSRLLLRKRPEVDALYLAFNLVLDLGVCINFG